MKRIVLAVGLLLAALLIVPGDMARAQDVPVVERQISVKDSEGRTVILPQKAKLSITLTASEESGLSDGQSVGDWTVGEPRTYSFVDGIATPKVPKPEDGGTYIYSLKIVGIKGYGLASGSTLRVGSGGSAISILRLRKPVVSALEYSVIAAFLVAAIFLSWYLCLRLMYTSLMRGRNYLPSRAQSSAMVWWLGLCVLAILVAGIAFVWPGVSVKGWFPYVGLVSSFVAYFVVCLVVWIVAKTTDRPARN